jgi:hypothetical protein
MAEKEQTVEDSQQGTENGNIYAMINTTIQSESCINFYITIKG